MISRKPKKLVPAREQLQALTPAELTEVSGGGQSHRGHGNHHEHGHHHHKRHHRHYR
jgi:hypothetical protein